MLAGRGRRRFILFFSPWSLLSCFTSVEPFISSGFGIMDMKKRVRLELRNRSPAEVRRSSGFDAESVRPEAGTVELFSEGERTGAPAVYPGRLTRRDTVYPRLHLSGELRSPLLGCPQVRSVPEEPAGSLPPRTLQGANMLTWRRATGWVPGSWFQVPGWTCCPVRGGGSWFRVSSPLNLKCQS